MAPENAGSRGKSGKSVHGSAHWAGFQLRLSRLRNILDEQIDFASHRLDAAELADDIDLVGRALFGAVQRLEFSLEIAREINSAIKAGVREP